MHKLYKPTLIKFIFLPCKKLYDMYTKQLNATNWFLHFLLRLFVGFYYA